MNTKTDESLHPAVHALAETLTETQGQWAFPDDALAAHAEALSALKEQHKEKLVTDIMVLSGRLQREVPEQGIIALAQLMALTAYLLGSLAAAEQAFDGFGLEVSEAKKIIGSQKVQFTDSSHKKAGEAAASLLGVLSQNRS